MGTQLLPVDSALSVEFSLKLLGNPLKRSAFSPPAKPVLGRPPPPVPLWKVSPGGTGPKNPEDPARDLPVIAIRAAAALNLPQEVLDTLVLFIGEPTATASDGVEA